jgi:phosphate acetyltransferase
MSFADELLARAKTLNKKVVLPETEDERTLHAAERLSKERICVVVLVGDPDRIHADARQWAADISGCEILSPLCGKTAAPLAEKLWGYRKDKGLTEEQARELIKDYLYFGTMLLKEGIVDGYVAGATHTTGDNLRPGLQIIKAAPGVKPVPANLSTVRPETIPHQSVAFACIREGTFTTNSWVS